MLDDIPCIYSVAVLLWHILLCMPLVYMYMYITSGGVARLHVVLEHSMDTKSNWPMAEFKLFQNVHIIVSQ